MDLVTPFSFVADAIVEAGGEDLNLCYQCATCTASCPWSFVAPLNMRELIHLAQLGLDGYESEELWKCTTCGTCVERCPRGVGIITLVRSIRMMIGESGLIPPTLRGVLGSARGDGNPWKGDREDRNRWAARAGIEAFDAARHEYLLYACCMPSYDPRAKKSVLALARVLRAAGVSFGMLGSEESCCGESVRKIGSEQTFARLATDNSELFARRKARKLLVTSPHCFYTFKNEYPAHGAEDLEVVHAAQLLARLLEQGRLQPVKPQQATVAFHDPCYLGRHSEIFDAPRKVLAALPGVTCVELHRTRESSLCCGGGGGRMWMETEAGERFSDLRLPEALAVGADVLATACPYCVQMLEDSRLSLGHQDQIEVRELCELVADSLEL